MDYVFFSENLKRYYPKVYNELTEILSKHDMHYGVLKGTADYWCRDYMPVQVDGNSFVQFKYHPDYLEGLRESLPAIKPGRLPSRQCNNLKR